jgi:hypothetical protein
VKPTLVLLLEILGVALVAAAGFVVGTALGLLAAGVGVIAFAAAWERKT